ncbi:SCO1664 family protein [Tomitella fengzijianii]|uniref:SCO1664 family protein n=1 Tax=Tomitella fengzijianii TaxID=2597660 RepID=A0A516X2T6_9ACTN|nr:SCO1664 family protein [Tomitella fengzijianii]QDQ97392.1 SCO1664 family protein [Tomitella fengzijianii]
MTVPAPRDAAHSGDSRPAGGEHAPLATAPIEIIGRLTTASNATFLCRLDAPGSEVRCVYKPVLGERPLWDFPDGTLAEREYASYLISTALGWEIIPRTELRSGPHGWGMVQEWIEAPSGRDADGRSVVLDSATDLVDLFPADSVPAGYLPVFAAEDMTGRQVVLAHADDERLQRIAVLDAVLNNPDRKAGHILCAPGGGLRGVDHGICLHGDSKLRTVLWGWAHRPIPPELLGDVAALGDGLRRRSTPLADALDELLTLREVEALARRIDGLTESGMHPGPTAAHAIPWPPF